MALFRLIYRLTAMAVIQLAAGLLGLAMVLVLGPLKKIHYSAVASITNLWGRLCCRVMNIRIHREGALPKTQQGKLIVTNHIGSADIFVLAACFKTFFVSKSDIRSWPIFGILARFGATIFIDRTRRTKVPGMVRDLTERLRAGFAVAVFPEGGATPGHRVEHFKSAAFESVVQSGGAVLPVMIRYANSGEPPVAQWPQGMPFWEHARRLLVHPRLDVRVCILPELAGETDRRAFAEKSRQLISDKYGETREGPAG